MAEHLNKASVAFALSLALGGVLSSAHAESFPDPTRPPLEMGSAGQGAVDTPAGPVLQSVYLSAGRKSAIISGQAVKLGGKYGDARVVSISESEVVLKSGTMLQTLKLFPDVSKSPVSRDRRGARDTTNEQGKKIRIAIWKV